VRTLVKARSLPDPLNNTFIDGEHFATAEFMWVMAKTVSVKYLLVFWVLKIVLFRDLLGAQSNLLGEVVK
jgi:hypothetical protein